MDPLPKNIFDHAWNIVNIDQSYKKVVIKSGWKLSEVHGLKTKLDHKMTPRPPKKD